MKKTIYYLAVALLATVLAIVSILNITTKTREPILGLFNTTLVQNAESTVQKVSALDTEEVYDYICGEISSIPNARLIKSTMSYSMKDQNEFFGGNDIFADRKVNNIFATIGDTNNNDVLLIVAHYDKPLTSQSAAGTALNVAVMLEAVKQAASGAIKTTNTIAFLFTDGYFEGNIGLRKALELPKILYATSHSIEHSLIARTKLIINLENFGTSGGLTLFGTSEAEYNAVKLYVDGGGRATEGGSALKNIYSLNYADNDTLSVLKSTDANVLSFGAFNDRHLINTVNDKYDESFSLGLLKQSGESLLTVLSTFGVGTLDIKTKGSATTAVYFSYLGLDTFLLNDFGVFLIISLTVLCLAAALFLNSKREKSQRYNYYQILLAASLHCVLILLGLAAAFILQLFLGLFGTFGAILRSPFYSSAVVLIGFVIFALAMAAIAKIVFDKHFADRLRIGERELHTAPALIFIFLSLLFSILSPASSYLFSITALICSINLLVKNSVNNEILDKINLDIIALALSLPIIIPFIAGLTAMTGTIALAETIPLIGLLFMFVIDAVSKLRIPFINAPVSADSAIDANTSATAVAETAGASDTPADATVTDAATVDDASIADVSANTAAPDPAPDTADPDPAADTADLDPDTSAPDPAPKQSFMQRFSAFFAMTLAGIIGFVFLFSGGLNSNLRSTYGLNFSPPPNLSSFDRDAYTNSISYIYGQKINREEQVDAGFYYLTLGGDNYRSIRNYTDMFSSLGTFARASTTKRTPSSVPAFSIISDSPTWRKDDSEENASGETEGESQTPVIIYSDIIYSINIIPARQGATYELVISNFSNKLSLLTINDGFGVKNYREDIIAGNKSIKVYLDSEAMISLHFNDIDEQNFDKIPRPTMTYREVWHDAPIPNSLDFINSIEGLRYNIIYKYEITFLPFRLFS